MLLYGLLSTSGRSVYRLPRGRIAAFNFGPDFRASRKFHFMWFTRARPGCWLLCEVLRSGDYVRHLDEVRPFYEEKAARLEGVLERSGLRARGWRWESPAGGLLLWLRAPEGLDTSFDGPLWRAAMEETVLYVPGDLCFAEGIPRNFVRLSFGALAADRIGEATERFVRAASRVAG